MVTAAEHALEFPSAGVRHNQLLIGGRWTDATDSAWYDIVDPSSGAVFARAADASAADVERAVAAAVAAGRDEAYRRPGAVERGRMLWQLGDRVLERGDELAELESRDSGRPLTITRTVDIPITAGFFQVLSSWCTMQGSAVSVDALDTALAPGTAGDLPSPGVAALFGSSELPLVSAAARIAPALAAGKAMVFIADSNAPLSALYLAELAQEVGIADGVLNVLTRRDAGMHSMLARHRAVRRIEYHGERRIARTLARDAAHNLASASITAPGSRPEIVFADADIEQAASGVVDSLLLAADQGAVVCGGVYVEHNAYTAVAARVGELVRDIACGPATAPETRLGPCLRAADAVAAEQRLKSVARAGIEVVRGSAPTGGEHGFYAAPALVAGPRVHALEEAPDLPNRILWLAPFKRDEFDEIPEFRNGRLETLGLWTGDPSRIRHWAERLGLATLRMNYVPGTDTRALVQFYTHHRYPDHALVAAARAHRAPRTVLTGL